VRRAADGVRDDLRAGLGPEHDDLELRDLDPRNVVRKHLAEAWRDDD
jgi:sec-independent protein translocase protein TatB